MQQNEQVEQARKLLAYLQSHTTAMAQDVYRNPVREYVCPRQLAQERELFLSAAWAELPCSRTRGLPYA